MAPSWPMHRSNELWIDPPADVFYPDRFLVRDEKKTEPVGEREGQRGEKEEEEEEEEEERRVFSTSGTAGKFFPFGGGAHVCPGRVFAKQEILAAVATVLRGFEFEFVEWVDGKKGFPGYKKGYVGLGVMAMEWDARVRVRRRRRPR